MNERPLRPCAHPGCRVLTRGGRCDTHKAEKRRQDKTARGQDFKHLYNSARWRKFRADWLRRFPLCGQRVDGRSSEHSVCAKSGIARPALIADHIEPHRGDESKFLDEHNIQSLCKDCHDRKTGQEMRARQLGKTIKARGRDVSLADAAAPGHGDGERLAESLAPDVCQANPVQSSDAQRQAEQPGHAPATAVLHLAGRSPTDAVPTRIAQARSIPLPGVGKPRQQADALQAQRGGSAHRQANPVQDLDSARQANLERRSLADIIAASRS